MYFSKYSAQNSGAKRPQSMKTAVFVQESSENGGSMFLQTLDTTYKTPHRRQ